MTGQMQGRAQNECRLEALHIGRMTHLYEGQITYADLLEL